MGPDLPEPERSHDEIASTHQIGVQFVLTIAAMKQEPLVRAIVVVREPTLGTGFARIVGIDFDGQRSSQSGFIGNQSMKLSKGPWRAHPVRAAHSRGRRLRPFAPLFALALAGFGALADVGEIF